MKSQQNELPLFGIPGEHWDIYGCYSVEFGRYTIRVIPSYDDEDKHPRIMGLLKDYPTNTHTVKIYKIDGWLQAISIIHELINTLGGNINEDGSLRTHGTTGKAMV